MARRIAVPLIAMIAAAGSATGCKSGSEPDPQTIAPPPAPDDAAVQIAPPELELAHLELWAGEPSEMALAKAAACDKGDAAACYRLGNLYEEGIGTPGDMARAHALHARACEAGRGEACRILGLLLTYESGPPADAARSLQLLTRACDLDFLDACATVGGRLLADDATRNVADGVRLLTRGCQRGYWPACRALESHRSLIENSGIAFPSLLTLPVEDLPVPTLPTACPPNDHFTTSTGGGARLNGGLAQVPHELLLAAIPKKLAGWKQEIRASSPAGTAGTRASAARVRLTAKDRVLAISIADVSMNCTLRPRMSEMAAQLPPSEGYEKEAVDIDGRPAVWMRAAHDAALSMWLANRCTVHLSVSPSVSKSKLVAIAKRIDLDALDAACAKREPGF
jgi:hypothetical protein